MRLPVNLASIILTCSAHHRRVEVVHVSHHLAYGWCDEDLEAHQCTDRVAGQAEDRGVADEPECEGLCRFDRNLHPPHPLTRDLAEYFLGEVEVPDAHSAGRDEGIAAASRLHESLAKLLLRIPDDAEIDRGGSRSGK